MTSILLQETNPLQVLHDLWVEAGWPPGVFWILVLSGISVLIYLMFHFRGKEREQRRGSATSIGLSPIASEKISSRFTGFELLSKLNSRVEQAFYGSFDGTPVFLFVHQTGSGSHTSEVTCVGIESSTCTLPQFSVQPADRVRRLFLFLEHLNFDTGPRPRVVEFPDSREFSEVYRVYATDPEAARKTVDESVRALLEASRGLAVECNGPRFMSYHPGRTVPEEEMHDFLGRSLRIFRHMCETSSAS